MKKVFLVIGGVFTFLLCLVLFHAMMFAFAYGMEPLAIFIGLAILVIGGVQAFFWYVLGKKSVKFTQILD
jgi:hypothetical protein